MTRPPTITAALQARVRRRGGNPLITYYDTGTGERTELSATSFANWVDKTANLLDALGVEPGVIAGPLSLGHPGHWVSLIWPLAAWQRGCTWLAAERSAGAVLTVVGPDPAEADGPTVACSLDPLARPLPAVPVGVIDYTREVLAEPDAHWAVPVRPDAIAWRDATRALSHADLTDLEPIEQRVLLRAGVPWHTLSAGLLRPLLGGGSAVIVAGETDGPRLERLAASERATIVTAEEGTLR